MVLDYWMTRDGIAEGFAIVFDMTGSTFSHLTKVNIGVMRKFLYYVQVRDYQLTNNLNRSHIYKRFFNSCFLGSVADSTSGFSLHQYSIVYRQNASNDETIYKKGIIGYGSFAQNT